MSDMVKDSLDEIAKGYDERVPESSEIAKATISAQREMANEWVSYVAEAIKSAASIGREEIFLSQIVNDEDNPFVDNYKEYFALQPMKPYSSGYFDVQTFAAFKDELQILKTFCAINSFDELPIETIVMCLSAFEHEFDVIGSPYVDASATKISWKSACADVRSQDTEVM